MADPWFRADVTVDEALAAALIAEQFPALAGARPRLLDEGWGSRAFTVGAEWLFRFPKIRPADGGLAVEIRLLPLLAPRLPVAIPRFEHIGGPVAAYPFRFVGYRPLPGEEVQAVWPAVDSVQLGRSLGRVLRELHRFPVDEAARAGVERDGWRLDLTTRWPTAQPFLERLEPDERARLAPIAAPPASYAGPVRLVHGDIMPNHVLVDATGLSGLIDWGDVALGDPAADLAGVLYVAGPAALSACLAGYDLPLDPGALERARFYVRYAAAMDLAWGRATGRDLVAAAALRAIAHCEVRS
jgi:aminoglycoside phosphotransferase (APT) family kinase protein